MARKYRKAQLGRPDEITVTDFPGDDPENDDVIWVKIKRPNGATFSRLTALQGLTKTDETGKMVLAMNPIDALIHLLPENIIEWNLIDVETDEPLEKTAENIFEMDPPDFQHLLNAWSTLIGAGRKPATPKVDDPKESITMEEKKESPTPLAKELELSEVGGTHKRQLQLVLPLADG